MMTDHLLKALKRALRAKGVSYSQAGKVLGLSESSIKRLFAEKAFTLQRVEKLCDLAEIEFSQLIHMAEAEQQQLDKLSTQQEQDIINDPVLLLTGVCIINQCTFDEILEKYSIKKTELIKCFAKLDKFGVIEYLPGNRYRLKLSKGFSWNPGGPIQRFFIETLLKEYLVNNIQDENNHLHYVWGMLTKESSRELNNKIKKVIHDYIQLANNEAKLPMSNKMTSSLLVVFRENWEPDVFKSRQSRG